jgi:hypothetical protein
MKEKEIDRFSIHDCYRELQEAFSELLKLEKEKTFSPDQLQIWISKLQNLSLECPCELFSYSIEDDNCYFSTCENFNSHSRIDGDDWELSCDYCFRASYWVRIQFFVEELDRAHRTNMWKILTCLYLSRSLQKLKI